MVISWSAYLSPTVRQRTIQAISALSTGGVYPLSLREIARRIRHEDDDSVLASLLRIYAYYLDVGVLYRSMYLLTLLQSGAREADASRRRRQFDSVFNAAARKMDADSPLVIAAIRALVAIVRTLPRRIDGLPNAANTDELAIHGTVQTRSLLGEAVELHTTPGVSPWARGDMNCSKSVLISAACLLETSALATALYEIDGKLGDGVEMLLEHLRRLLVPPPDKGKGKQAKTSEKKPSATDTANNRILTLRCFGVLPPVAWQNGLTEAHMGALMGGVDSTDPTVRKETLRLLSRVDRNLPSMTFESYLEALRTGRGLPLPPNVSPSMSQKQAITEGRIEAACRALETADVLSEGLSDEARGVKLADSVSSISAALSTGDPQLGVWLKGVQAVIGDLQGSSTPFRQSFIETVSKHLASTPSDPTVAVLVTTAAVEYPVAPAKPTIDALVAALPMAGPSVQELVVLALVPLLARLDDRTETTAHVTTALKGVQESAIKHMAKRCEEVVIIIERGLVDTVVQRSKSSAVSSCVPGHADCAAAE
jgi:hypothetical protein